MAFATDYVHASSGGQAVVHASCRSVNGMESSETIAQLSMCDHGALLSTLTLRRTVVPEQVMVQREHTYM
eukprot:4136216-Pleurochrysis_carterae.AAC.3